MDRSASRKIWVSAGCANLLGNPRQGSELLSQYLYAEPVEAIGQSGNYIHVNTQDKQTGWIHKGSLWSGDEQYVPSEEGEQLICISPMTILKSKADPSSEGVLQVFLGCLLDLDEPVTNYYLKGHEWLRIKLIGGNSAYVSKKDFAVFANFKEKNYDESKSAVEWARRLLGLNYLWGGTTAVALDCSGLTQLVYRMTGKLLPRNSYQQAECGEPVDILGNFLKITPADLIFFREEEKVSHVGIGIGDARFIHASASYGKVVITSFNEADREFDPLFVKIFHSVRRHSWKK